MKPQNSHKTTEQKRTSAQGLVLPGSKSSAESGVLLCSETPRSRTRGIGSTWAKETFFANTIRDGADNCWIWAGAKKYEKDGRPVCGCTSFHWKQMSAHRLAYQFARGKIPKGKQINHSCNVELCVRPDHIYAGTAADNKRDSVAMHMGNRTHDYRAQEVANRRSYRAWRNGNIRDLYASGNWSMSQIAAIFSFDESTVSYIVNWKR